MRVGLSTVAKRAEDERARSTQGADPAPADHTRRAARHLCAQGSRRDRARDLSARRAAELLRRDSGDRAARRRLAVFRVPDLSARAPAQRARLGGLVDRHRVRDDRAAAWSSRFCDSCRR